MHLEVQNINEAFQVFVGMFSRKPEQVPFSDVNSRNGPVRMINEPVIITYKNPRERVLFHSGRDANPFFHLFESLWMLAGRNDIEPLCRYVKTYSDFSDDGVTANGAYGYRWRYSQAQVQGEMTVDKGKTLHLGMSGNDFDGVYRVDQLQTIIDHLKANPNSRRAVLQMWNVEDDLLKVDSSKDVCCNLSVMFSIRNTVQPPGPGTPEDYGPVLDMTVTNRSNDLVWGALGANVVHFSFLQEYMANCLGCRVGLYHQITNNLHVYLDKFMPQVWLQKTSDPISGETSIQLVRDQVTFDREVQEFIDNSDWSRRWNEPFLDSIASPMMWAHHLHKLRKYDNALSACEEIEAADWRYVCTAWIIRRKMNWEAKKGG